MHRNPPKHRGRGRGRPKRLAIRPGSDRKLDAVFRDIGTPEKTPFQPDPYQLAAIEAIESHDCLVTAPTGAGKTWIAQQTIARIRETGGNAWYASPLKALTNSKYIEFSQDFGTENVGILTGDRKENPEAPVIVGTTEILRNQLYDAMYQGRDLATDFVILDEAHFLGDPDRGVVWEEIMIYLPPRIPLLMLSATIGNADQISGWLTAIRGRQCEVIHENRRPVPLYPLFLHPSGTLWPLLSGNGKSGKKSTKLYKKVQDYLGNRRPPRISPPGKLPPFGEILQVLKKYRLTPVIFFLKSRADCNGALELSRKNILKDPERKREIRDRIREFTEQIPRLAEHEQIAHLENFGVGAHHSGQLPAWKLLVESLMTDGLLDAVYATSTVAAGVNFPARTVAFLNSDKFNGIDFFPLNPTEFHQMTGRAGRRGMDNIGFALAIPGRYMNPRLIAKLIHASPEDVKSQIKINFSMTLNLLLSHGPEQIEELLKRSFAAYQIAEKPRQKDPEAEVETPNFLWKDFQRHFEFLVQTRFAEADGRLTEDGVWAAQLRVDQPLLIAEGFRKGLFPESDPRMLAAIVAAFVNERESDDRIDDFPVPNQLQKVYNNIKKGLKPFAMEMFQGGFEIRPLYLRPALTLFLWTSGLYPWEKVQQVAALAEGDLSMLVLRTADNLRHVAALHDHFPQAANSARKAIEQILRDPVITYLEP
jgi:superfamily II RNA helicase